ncbi:hypothetical protein FA15DRAFT_423825 [Coprinopsis marcescibilis]|uniref:Uncharacterized protein n=1 Tax=Coprinopsis marcescibilis TaxID=230819 RepID=A0A5C3KUP4_COPMA|nr:hypothetical protein FA15DRAFT_423825 [Coprinopsis marcescibilis]
MISTKYNGRKAVDTVEERTAKKPRLSNPPAKFTNISAVQVALRTQGAVLVRHITTLRSQLSLRPSEIQSHVEDPRTKLVQPNDERLLLVDEWCKISPGLPELFAGWDAASDDPGNDGASITSLILSVLTNIFTLLSTSYAFQADGALIVKNITLDHWRRLNTYVTGTQGRRSIQGPSNELVLVSLRLLTVICEKWDAKRVYENIGWESKGLPKLFAMKKQGRSTGNPILKPDIRTAFILFLLAFLRGASSATNYQTKTAFLSTSSSVNNFLAIFKTLHADHPAVIKRVLEVCWEGVWCDIRISRSLKIAVFGDLYGVITNLLKIYDHTEPPDSDAGIDYSPADLIHHFMLAICTRPGIGLCFKDRGWYPREGDETSEEPTSKQYGPSRIYNKILSQLLRVLKVTDDPRQHELALKILAACPELVAGYLPTSGLTLDPPRLSSKWLANIAFVTNVLSLPIPVTSFHLSEETKADSLLYKPVPPPVNIILGNVIPTSQNMNMKNVFTKGLQFTTPGQKSANIAGNLVQHTTALALLKCLDKLARVKQAFEKVASALGESPTEGQWTRRLKEVMKEVRRRLPEFQVVIAFCSVNLRAFMPQTDQQDAKNNPDSNPTSSASHVKRKALLAECAMRLLWMYQKCLPEVVDEARFDVGKILVGFEFGHPEPDEEEEDDQGGRDDGESSDEDGADQMDEDDEGEGEATGSGPEDTDGEDPEEGQPIPPVDDELDEITVARRLHRITQLHILRFLQESGAFVSSGGWTGKSFTNSNGQNQTHLHTLMTQLLKFHPSTISQNQDATGGYESSINAQIGSLVKHILSSTLLFQDDPEEVDLWLNSLPIGPRRVKIVTRPKKKGGDEGDVNEEDEEMETLTLYPEAPDGTRLTDERESVISFFDECVQRFLKAPYKYIEEMTSLTSTARSTSTSDSGAGEAMDIDSVAEPTQNVSKAAIPTPSALLCTVVEQLLAKVKGKFLPPSDVLAITTYLRKLLFALLAKVDVWSLERSSREKMFETNPSLAVLVSVTIKLDEGLQLEKMVFPDEEKEVRHAIVKAAIRREVGIVWGYLGGRSEEVSSMESPEEVAQDSEDVDDFLELVDGLDLPPSRRERQLTAYELIDWVRLLDSTLNQAQAALVFGIVKRIGGRWALRELVGCFGTSRYGHQEFRPLVDSNIWDVLGLETDRSQWNGIPFELLLFHAQAQQLLSERCQKVLVESLDLQSNTTSLQPVTGLNTSRVLLERALRIIMHRLLLSRQDTDTNVSRVLIALIGRIMENEKGCPTFVEVKQVLFNGQLPALKETMMSTDAFAVADGIGLIQKACLDFACLEDRRLVAEIAAYWRDFFINAIVTSSDVTREQTDYALSWITYLDAPMLLDFLEGVLRSNVGKSSSFDMLRLLHSISDPLRLLAEGSSSTAAEMAELLGSRISLLFRLRAELSTLSSDSTQATFEAIDELIAVALEANIPVGLNGTLDLGSEQPLTGLLGNAESRLKKSIIEREATNPSPAGESPVEFSTGRIVGSLFYRGSRHGHEQTPTLQEVSQESLVDWISSTTCQQRPITDLIPAIRAALDCDLRRSSQNGTSPSKTLFFQEGPLVKLFEGIFTIFKSEIWDKELRKQVKSLVVSLLQSAHQRDLQTKQASIHFWLKMFRKWACNNTTFISPEWISIGHWIQQNIPNDSHRQALLEDLVQNTMQFLVAELGDARHGSDFSDVEDVAHVLSSLLSGPKRLECPPAMLENVLTAVIGAHLDKPNCLNLIEKAVLITPLKPLVINRHLQAIVQHPHFFRLFNSTANTRVREAISSLLDTLFHLHPSNTCQTSHVEPLIRVYRGSLSKSDRNILNILQLFERQRKLSSAALFAKWSNNHSHSAVYTPSSTSLEALQSLDPVLVLRSSLAFPSWRNFDGATPPPRTILHEDQLYDPIFLMLLFQHMMMENPPTGAIPWIELFRSNVVGLIVRAMSANDGRVRSLSASLLAALAKLLEHADLQERPHVLYILGQLRNLLARPTLQGGKYPERLPSYITLLLLHSLRGVFNPSSFIYPLTSRFLLQRPELDPTDVPLLYSLLYSSSDEYWKKERSWILRFLADGMLVTGSGSQDWKILKRRHTWDLLASMYQSTNSVDKDKSLKQGVLSVLVNLTRHRKPCLSLVLKSGLLAWVEMQLVRDNTALRDEGVAWAKVLENITAMLDADKLVGSAIEDEWKSCILRCLSVLLGSGQASATHVLPFAARIMFRLAHQCPAWEPTLVKTLFMAIARLQDLETGILLSDTIIHAPPLDEIIPPALHNSHDVHDKPVFADPLALWGRLVELLWRVVMSSNCQEPEIWNKLTSRLLVWRAIVGEENSKEGEWARIQCVLNLGLG